MNDTALTLLGNAQSEVLDVSFQLRELSSAAYRVGLDRMSDELSHMAGRMDTAQKAIGKGIGEASSHSARVSEEATGNMMRATIAALTSRAVA